MSIANGIRALGKENLPAEITLNGRAFRLRTTFAHTSAAAVGLYQAGGGEAVVLKCYRKAPLFGIPMAWAGKLMAAYEAAVLRHVQGIRGVPRLRGMYGSTGLVRDYIAGEPLTRRARVADEFCAELFRLLGELHARGIAYVDLEKGSNIVLGEDGLPHLIDFQVAFYVPDRFLGQSLPVRCIRKRLQQADLYHARKHFRRLRRDQLSDEEIARLRERPWLVRLANALYSPFKKARRRIMGRGQSDK